MLIKSYSCYDANYYCSSAHGCFTPNSWNLAKYSKNESELWLKYKNDHDQPTTTNPFPVSTRREGYLIRAHQITIKTTTKSKVLGIQFQLKILNIDPVIFLELYLTLSRHKRCSNVDRTFWRSNYVVSTLKQRRVPPSNIKKQHLQYKKH